MNKRARILIVLLGAVVLATAVFFLPPLGSGNEYHQFADQRAWLGIPNAADTLSSLAFVLTGCIGLTITLGKRRASLSGLHRSERWPYTAFFSGVVLAGVGSAYYHLHPDNARELWDRLALSLVVTAFIDAQITERIDRRIGLRLLPWALVAGAASVLFWSLNESHQQGDMRFYADGGLLVLLLMAALFPSPYSRGRDVYLAVGWWGLAILFEAYDRPVFHTMHFVSGHTLKHLCAATATLWIARMLRARRPILLPERDAGDAPACVSI